MGQRPRDIPTGHHVEYRMRYTSNPGTAREHHHDLTTRDPEQAAFWHREATRNPCCVNVRLTRREVTATPWETVDGVA